MACTVITAVLILLPIRVIGARAIVDFSVETPPEVGGLSWNVLLVWLMVMLLPATSTTEEEAAVVIANTSCPVGLTVDPRLNRSVVSPPDKLAPAVVVMLLMVIP